MDHERNKRLQNLYPTPDSKHTYGRAEHQQHHVYHNMSANTMHLKAPHHVVDPKLVVKVLKILVVLLVIALAAVIASKILLAPMQTRTLKNSGYAYSFKFYRSSQTIKTEGREGLKKGDKVAFNAFPSERDKEMDECYDVGEGWTEVFSTKIEGEERPVCAAKAYGGQVYFTNYRSGNVTHSFTLVYREVPGAQEMDESEVIMGSIDIKKQED